MAQNVPPASGARILLLPRRIVSGERATLAVLDVLRACSPQGLRETKPLLTAGMLDGFETRAEALADQSARLFGSAEAGEGMRAFLEKRQPSWAAE